MQLGWYLSIKYQRTSIIGCSYAMGGYLSMKYLSLKFFKFDSFKLHFLVCLSFPGNQSCYQYCVPDS